MSKNFKFWAVVDKDGICDVKNEKHRNLKAIFSSESDARKVIENNPGVPIKVVSVQISKVRTEE
ncbi:hypothetical protein [Erwinia aphidicola]|uniref:hypothetical protein n=1 Tax=Erwinia aphidicola TaxID=68334 RepID=UPI0030CEB064